MPRSYGIAPATSGGLLPWNSVSEQLARSRNYWVCTTRPDGAPHAAPVWGVWLDDAFYFSTDPASRKGRNLAADPRIVVHLESGDEVVILEGRAARVADPALLERFVAAYAAKYDFRLEASDLASRVYRVQPRTAYAWHEEDFPQSATRWRFEDR